MSRRTFIFIIIAVLTALLASIVTYTVMLISSGEIDSPKDFFCTLETDINFLAQMILEPYGAHIHAGIALILAVLVIVWGIRDRDRLPPTSLV